MEDSNHRKAFEEFARRAERQLGDSLEKLVLYGSVARGDESEDSDVDVFVVVEEGFEDDVYELAAAVGRSWGVHLQVVVRDSKDYEETKDTFFTREVVESGQKVV
jgi:predicted nucleotidyltransferase